MRDIKITRFAIAAQLEPEILSAVLTKLSFMYPDSDGDIVLHVAKRKESGWLEWTAYIYGGGNVFTLGIIQRQVGAELEYHS